MKEKSLEDRKVKEYIIIYYKKLLDAAIKREDYESAIKYKKWIENLEKSGKK
ncbi:MAG: hypothetical protein HPY57_15350 [Ignavibacteria bacterium]|nr:hypothetical protein [Ignavibacteria bacterium]